ncbi:MAG: SH3 domain protein [Planctomycetota bacterium]|jgi:SH3 domain protein
MKAILISCILTLVPASLMAENVYISDQLKAGLHEDKSLESPIVKIVVTGTRLEVVKREEQLTFVRDESGSTGWINNMYLMAKAPANASLDILQTRADNLETRLTESKEKILTLEAELKKQGKVLPEETLAYRELKKAHAELNQTSKAQKLKVGELQIELTELRKRVGQDSGSDSLYQQIKTLEEDKKKLEIRLANTLDKYEAEGAEGIDALRGENSLAGRLSPGVRNMTIYLLITLVLGLFAGAYLLDLVNRRRHGGFRI